MSLLECIVLHDTVRQGPHLHYQVHCQTFKVAHFPQQVHNSTHQSLTHISLPTSSVFLNTHLGVKKNATKNTKPLLMNERATQ